jgi:hypothetical protein
VTVISELFKCPSSCISKYLNSTTLIHKGTTQTNVGVLSQLYKQIILRDYLDLNVLTILTCCADKFP